VSFRSPPIEAAIEAAIKAAIIAGIIPSGPEFVDAKGLKTIYGISRSHGYHLADEGAVKTVCLRKPGALRGKRLWECQSVREYLRANIDHRSK
jgi:hypothetical protein